MSTFEVVWPVCVSAALALSGCVMDTSESDDGDNEWIGEITLGLEEGEEDDASGTERQGDSDDGSSSPTETGIIVIPNVEPDPEPWDPGDGQGSDDT